MKALCVLKPVLTRILILAPIIAGTWSVSAAMAEDQEKSKPAEGQSAESKAEAGVGTGPWISSVRWVDDSQLVVTESQGLLLRTGKVHQVKVADTGKLEQIGESETSIWNALPVGEGRVLASNYKGEVFQFGGGEPQKFELTARWIRALEKAPGDGQALAGTEDGKLIVLSLSDRKETKRIDAHSAAIFDIAINPAGDKLATVAGDGSIKLWNWPSLEAAGSMAYGSEAVWAVLFTSDGKRLVTGGSERRVRLWDIAQSKLVVSLAVTPDWVTSLTALPESNLVAAGCMNGKVVIVDVAAMAPVIQLDGPGSAIWSVASSPSGKHLAIGTRKHGLSLLSSDAWQAAAKEVSDRAAAEKPPAPKK